MTLLGAALGLAAGLGIWLVAVGWQAGRVPTVEQRVAPYLRDVLPDRDVTSTWQVVVGPWLSRTAQRLGETISSTASVHRRLVRLGVDPDVDAFRVRQAWAGLVGFAVAVVFSMSVWRATGGHVVGLLVLCVTGFVIGAWWTDASLSRQVAARETRIREEFPSIAELIALSVAAGESPIAAIDRVGSLSSGPMSEELGRVVADVRAGHTVSAAFDDLAHRTGVTSLARFADALSVAIERGTPLIDVLHAQAGDVREAGRRELIESGGRREIAMMLPVVFLILPVTVVFAFYPGLVGLQLTSGT